MRERPRRLEADERLAGAGDQPADPGSRQQAAVHPQAAAVGTLSPGRDLPAAPPARGSGAIPPRPTDVRQGPDAWDPAADDAHRSRADGSSLDATALEPGIAAQILRETAGQQTIVRTLLRGVLWRSRYAAALAVEGGNAVGREALGDRGLEPDLTRLVLPLAAVPGFRVAVATGAPYLGPVLTGNVSVDALLAELGGVVPPVALVLPVSVAGRVVGLIYAHHERAALSLHDIAEVVPLGVEAGAALARTLPAGQPSAPRAGASGRVASESDGRTTRVHTRAVPPTDASPGAETALPIDEVIRALEAGAPHGTAAIDEAIRRADETLAFLRVHFPEPTDADLAAARRSTPPWQVGPLLGLLVALGKRSVPLLIELLSSQDQNRRSCAALVCREVRDHQLIYHLFARVFDPEPAVRDAAIAALDSYTRPEIGDALEQLRNAVHGEPARAQMAAYAIARLGDVNAISDLIAATDRDSTTAEVARRVLVGMTGQDFGTKTKKWLAWWRKNRTRPQVAWLLDGLAHGDEPVRRAAIEGLTRLTGESFGYRADLARRARAAARARWLTWWEDVGRHRVEEPDADRAPFHSPSVSVLPADSGSPKPR